jgi:transposase-like protein
VRRIIYTTNAIEALNSKLRREAKTQFAVMFKERFVRA